MKPQLIQLSVVVAGKAHNPSILNPDFLALNNIVQKEWAFEVAETVNIPPLAIVRYKNGLSISVEQNKLQVTDVGATDDATKSKAAKIATSYVVALPHVRYTAVGINFNSFIEHESAESFLKDRFLKSGSWDINAHPVTAAGFRFVYPLEGGRITLSIDSGKTETESDEKGSARNKTVSAIIVNANFNRDCKGYPDSEQVAKHLQHLAPDWSTYQSTLRDALGTED